MMKGIRKIKINIGNYQITSDSLQFIVNKIGIVQEGSFTKAENVGKETIKPIAYCGKFEEALRYIPQDILKTNEDINIIMDKLNTIQEDIKALESYPVIFIKDDDEISIKKDKYEQLKIYEGELLALKEEGVEEWQGFDYAIINYYKGKKEIEKEEVE